MSKKQILNSALLIFALSLTLAACGLSPETSSPSAPPSTLENDAENDNFEQDEDSQEEPANAQSGPGDAGSGPDAAAETPPPLDLSNLEEFDTPTGVVSYRIIYKNDFYSNELEYHQESGEGVVNLSENNSYVREISEAGGENPTPHSFERWIIGFDSIAVSELGCTLGDYSTFDTLSAEERIGLGFSSWLPRHFITGEAEFAEAGLIVNGRSAIRYTLDKMNFELDPEPSMIFASLEIGEVYVDEETGSILRVEVKGVGVLSLGPAGATSIGDIHYELEFSDFDEEVVIEAPSDCNPDTLDSFTQFPILEPYLIVSIDPDDTYLDFSAFVPLQEAANFYKSALRAAGWTITEETSFSEEDVWLTFTNGSGLTLQVDLRQAPGAEDREYGTITYGTLVIYDF
jgi:hypothetical protein